MEDGSSNPNNKMEDDSGNQENNEEIEVIYHDDREGG